MKIEPIDLVEMWKDADALDAMGRHASAKHLRNLADEIEGLRSRVSELEGEVATHLQEIESLNARLEWADSPSSYDT